MAAFKKTLFRSDLKMTGKHFDILESWEFGNKSYLLQRIFEPPFLRLPLRLLSFSCCPSLQLLGRLVREIQDLLGDPFKHFFVNGDFFPLLAGHRRLRRISDQLPRTRRRNFEGAEPRFPGRLILRPSLDVRIRDWLAFFGDNHDGNNRFRNLLLSVESILEQICDDFFGDGLSGIVLQDVLSQCLNVKVIVEGVIVIGLDDSTRLVQEGVREERLFDDGLRTYTVGVQDALGDLQDVVRDRDILDLCCCRWRDVVFWNF